MRSKFHSSSLKTATLPHPSRASASHELKVRGGFSDLGTLLPSLASQFLQRRWAQMELRVFWDHFHSSSVHRLAAVGDSFKTPPQGWSGSSRHWAAPRQKENVCSHHLLSGFDTGLRWTKRPLPFIPALCRQYSLIPPTFNTRSVMDVQGRVLPSRCHGEAFGFNFSWITEQMKSWF